MHGNNGSIDGDNPAAMRYTEARLSVYGQTILERIEKQTIPFVANFDGSETEPKVLPTLLPNVLVNGANGIAAGFATNIPPFNITELLQGCIALIKNPNYSATMLQQIIKGPDFPTGGNIVCDQQQLDGLFISGKGKFYIQAKMQMLPNAKISIFQIPFDLPKAVLLQKLEVLRLENKIPFLKRVWDDSDKNGINIVLEFEKNRISDWNQLQTFLYQKTPLQVVYNANIVVIKDKKPFQTGVFALLTSFLEHAHLVLINEARFELAKAQKRQEVLAGLIKGIEHTNKMVSLVKNAANKVVAKTTLMAYFKLNEIQAEALVNLKLFNLTTYDSAKLREEYAKTQITIATQNKIINKKTYRNNLLITLFYKNIQRFYTPRNSSINVCTSVNNENGVVFVKEERGVCLISYHNYVKFLLNYDLNKFNYAKCKVKEADAFAYAITLNTLEYLVLVSSLGRIIIIPAFLLNPVNLSEIGTNLNHFYTLTKNETVVGTFAFKPNHSTDYSLILATKKGYIKRISYQNIICLAKKAKTYQIINLKENDILISATWGLVQEQIVVLSALGYVLYYPIEQIPLLSKNARGVKSIKLKNNDYVVATFVLPSFETFVVFVSNFGFKKIHKHKLVVTKRGDKGKKGAILKQNPQELFHSGFSCSGLETIFTLSYQGEISAVLASSIVASNPNTATVCQKTFSFPCQKAFFLTLRQPV